MNKILQIPLNKIRQEGNYKELREALERGFKKFDIDFYLVGATARDVWMRMETEFFLSEFCRDYFSGVHADLILVINVFSSSSVGFSPLTVLKKTGNCSKISDSINPSGIVDSAARSHISL